MASLSPLDLYISLYETKDSHTIISLTVSFSGAFLCVPFPLRQYYSNRVAAAHRFFGCVVAGCMPTITTVVIADAATGATIYTQTEVPWFEQTAAN